MRFGLPTRRPTRWLSLGMVAMVLAIVAVTWARSSKPVAASPTMATVQRGTVVVTATASGTVTPVRSRGLSFSMSGVVTELDVKAGDSVTAGQVLARIDDTDARNALDTAQTGLNNAQDSLGRAQQTATPTPTCPGTGTTQPTTAAPHPAGTPTPTSTASSTPTSTPSSTDPPTATPTATPTTTRPATPTSTATVTPTGTGRGAGGCTNTGGNSTGGNSGGGNSGAGGNGRGSSPDNIFSATQQVNNATLTLQQAQAKLAGTTITAPIAGKVLSVGGALGSQVSPGGTGFIVLGGLSDVAVEAKFSEADIAHLAVGQPATITLPNSERVTLDGTVSEIDPAGTLSGRLVRYRVLIAFDQLPQELLLGQSAAVAVITQSVTGVLYAPSVAVAAAKDGTASVLLRLDGRDERRTVRVGLRGDQYTEIQSGLAEGDRLVVAGNR